MEQLYKFIPEGQIGDFSISHLKVDASLVDAFKLKEALDRRKEYRDLREGIYTILSKNGTIITSDMPIEYRSSAEFLENAHGNVLIAGIGIGLNIFALQGNSEVDSITVVEKYQEVIDLVRPYLPLKKKYTVICSDIIDYAPPPPTPKFQTMYFDIWGKDNYDINEKEVLSEKLFEYLDISSLGSYFGFWREDEAIFHSDKWDKNASIRFR